MDRDKTIEAAVEFIKGRLQFPDNRNRFDAEPWIRWLMADFHITQTTALRKQIGQRLMTMRHENPCQGDCEICHYAKALTTPTNAETEEDKQ